MDHYFTREPGTPSRPLEIEAVVRGLRLTLYSDAGIFSGRRLDAGTKLLLDSVEFLPGEGVLDLGCGYGVAAIAAGHFTNGPLFLVDTNMRAAHCAARNVRRYGFGDRALVIVGDGTAALAPGAVERALCNPPIRAGRAVVARLIAGAAEVLALHGSLALVARTRQGADSIRRVLEASFGQVEIVGRRGGYKVFLARLPIAAAAADGALRTSEGLAAQEPEPPSRAVSAGLPDRSSTGE